jgi:hypothetical protein
MACALLLALLAPAIASGESSPEPPSTVLALAPTSESALAASVQEALGVDVADVADGSLPEPVLLAQMGSPADPPPDSTSAPDSTTSSLPPYESHLRPALALGEVVAVNLAVWTYDRFIRSGGGEGFRDGFQSWKQNIENGFNWDDNSFSTNQFGHPYQGSLTMNAGRSNGYGYFQSYAFTWLGSFLWEYFGETNYPALNDWINTSMGGAAFGEALFRLSRMVTDNTATGSGRFWREVGGTAISPVRGFTRIVTGEWGRVLQNDPDRLPRSHQVLWRFGARTEGSENLWTADTTHAFIEMAGGFGDPFLGEYKKPFQTFDFGLQLNFKDNARIGRVQAKGLLFATPYSRSENAQTLIGAWQYYDYIYNSAYEYGAQKIGASFMSLQKPAKNFEARTHMDLIAVILGATNSAYASISGRNYDYGPGFGATVGGEVRYKGHAFFTLSAEGDFIHTLNGTSSNHLLTETQIAFDIPLFQTYSLNFSYSLYTAQGMYEDFPDVYQKTPTLRTAISWHHGGSQ